MKTHNIIIPMNAKKGDFKPKNRIDHRILKNNCIPKKVKADLFFFLVSQTKYKDIPINTNKEIQTGENTQLGGLKEGLFNSTYHVETELLVKKDPIIPANWHIKIEIMNFINLLNFILFGKMN